MNSRYILYKIGLDPKLGWYSTTAAILVIRMGDNVGDGDSVYIVVLGKDGKLHINYTLFTKNPHFIYKLTTLISVMINTKYRIRSMIGAVIGTLSISEQNSFRFIKWTLGYDDLNYGSPNFFIQGPHKMSKALSGQNNEIDAFLLIFYIIVLFSSHLYQKDKMHKKPDYLSKTGIQINRFCMISSSGFQNLIQESSQKIFIVDFKKKV
ncbi:hypothetical protein AGLY_001731 [Aphis glycines]|uniref:Uncharacterized protein n=1 Tax=Aphis glycines TaxID=307491 RepID=A0A6G0U6Y2_APHGL|nr:hypothetical protein AGLY_001731 [Aphis glycines]